MNEAYKNIQTNGFVSSNHETKELNARVSQNVFGTFSLLKFAIMQFIMGVTTLQFTTNTKEEAEKIARLVAKLSREVVFCTIDNIVIDLTRTEIELLRKLLEFRITHCEYQRDNDSPEFNADTYISQKLLLLDIREWLMVSIIEEPAMIDTTRNKKEADPHINYTIDEEG